MAHHMGYNSNNVFNMVWGFRQQLYRCYTNVWKTIGHFSAKQFIMSNRSLRSNNLVGSIPLSIGDLTDLQYLCVSYDGYAYLIRQ